MKLFKDLFELQCKKFRLFLIYRSFFKSQYYKDAKKLYEEKKLDGLEFEKSFDLVKAKYEFLLKDIDQILNKNNLTIQEEINPEIIFSVFKYTLVTKNLGEYITHFYSKGNFTAAERMYFYILENYSNNQKTI